MTENSKASNSSQRSICCELEFQSILFILMAFIGH